MADVVDIDEPPHPAETEFEKRQRGPCSTGRGRRRPNTKSNSDTQISKTLSRLLRHQAERAGVKLDREGFARLDHVLDWPPMRSLNVGLADIRRVVQACDKQRFTLKPNPDVDTLPEGRGPDDPSHFLVRANQGHSLKLESEHMLPPISADCVPPTVLHGTFFVFWKSILESGGLKRQERQHIHCTTGTPEDGVVGMRRDSELVVEIDVAGSIQDGFKWWRSENGYILTEGDADGLLPIKYFKEVKGRALDVGVLVEHGQVKASLPDGIKIRRPPGKAGRRGDGNSKKIASRRDGRGKS